MRVFHSTAFNVECDVQGGFVTPTSAKGSLYIYIQFFLHIPLDLYRSLAFSWKIWSYCPGGLWFWSLDLIFIYNGRKSRNTSSPCLPIKRWESFTSPQVNITCSKLNVPLLTQVLSINYNTILALETFHMYSADFSRQRNYKTASRKEVNMMETGRENKKFS